MGSGQKSHFDPWVPYVRWVLPLNPSRMWTECHVCKQKFSAWHIGVYEIFCGIRETTIFFNGMCVNHSRVRMGSGAKKSFRSVGPICQVGAGVKS
jgi:hypothetical protein